MSVSRIFNELRPLVRLLDEPHLLSSRNYLRPLPDLFEPIFNSAAVGRRLAIEVSEQDASYVVEAEVPRFKKENIEVRVGNGGRSITLSGKVTQQQTAEPAANTDSNRIPTERSSFIGSSAFTRTVWLPQAVDASSVSAKLEDGVLRLHLPKAEDKGTINIAVL